MNNGLGQISGSVLLDIDPNGFTGMIAGSLGDELVSAGREETPELADRGRGHGLFDAQHSHLFINGNFEVLSFSWSALGFKMFSI